MLVAESLNPQRSYIQLILSIQGQFLAPVGLQNIATCSSCKAFHLVSILFLCRRHRPTLQKKNPSASAAADRLKAAQNCVEARGCRSQNPFSATPITASCATFSKCVAEFSKLLNSAKNSANC
jgi:hypothetical protein